MKFLDRYCISIFFIIIVCNNKKIQAGPIKCKDPSASELEKKWIEGRELYNNAKHILHNLTTKNITDTIQIDPNYKLFIFNYQRSTGSYGSTKEFQIQNYSPVKSEMMNAQCEFFYLLRLRENRLPKVLVESKCVKPEKNACPNISKDAIKKYSYKCTQLYKYELALERGNCVDNVYEWKIGIEIVPTGCNCMAEWHQRVN